MRLSAAALFLGLLSVLPLSLAVAHASFSVHYPKATRAEPKGDDYCGSTITDPRVFAAYGTTFASVSGNVDDLVTIKYSTNPHPTREEDFPHTIVKDIAISQSGQLCLEINVPLPATVPEFGVILMQSRDRKGLHLAYSCHDVKLLAVEILASLHPALCARGNDTLMMMPDEWVKPNVNP